MIFGTYQTTSGTYYDTLATVNLCDSVFATTLTVNPTAFNVSVSICEGDSILLEGSYQTIAGTYYDTLIASNGCDSVIVSTLTVNPTYTTNDSASICDGDSILLEGSYQTTAGTYYDTLIAANGCDSVIVSTLTVNPLPTKPTITQNGNELTSSPAAAYQWYYYDTIIIGAISQLYIVTKTGFYSVMITDSNSCLEMSDSIYVDVTAVKPIDFLSHLNIYPNPFSSNTTISIYGVILTPSSRGKNLTLEIYDLLGREGDASHTFSMTSEGLIVELHRGNLPNGLYFYKVTTGNETIGMGKLVIE